MSIFIRFNPNIILPNEIFENVLDTSLTLHYSRWSIRCEISKRIFFFVKILFNWEACMLLSEHESKMFLKQVLRHIRATDRPLVPNVSSISQIQWKKHLLKCFFFFFLWWWTPNEFYLCALYIFLFFKQKQSDFYFLKMSKRQPFWPFNCIIDAVVNS